MITVTKARFGGNAGFSLTELMIVVMVGVIITGYAVPAVDWAIDQQNLVLTGEAIANQLQYTRMRAVSGNEAFRLSFPSANSYQIELENGTLYKGPFQFGYGVSLNTADAGDPISFPGDQVLFLPSGALPLTGLGSAGRVKLINQAGLRIDIVVDSGGTIRKTPTYESATAPF